jgi:hypothetical protein
MYKHYPHSSNFTEQNHIGPPNYNLSVITDKKSLMSTALSTWDNEGGALNNNLDADPIHH